MGERKAKAKASVKVFEDHGYEFAGPWGALAISVGLPVLTYSAFLFCNEEYGCPVRSTLHWSTWSWASVKKETSWPGFLGLVDPKAILWTLAWYAWSILLKSILPATEVEGIELRNGGKLKYSLNIWPTSLITLGLAAIGTYFQGAEFPLWTYIWDHQLQLLSANMLIAFSLAWFCYLNSFSVKPGNPELRELAPGGHSGNIMYDWFVGRELNPRVTLPLMGTLDLKSFCELRPGMLGWMFLDLAYMMHQLRTYGALSDSIILITLFQSFYVLDSFYVEPNILTTMDITTDGFGFMLAFGDLAWLPFSYSLQARYLAMHPVHLGPAGISIVLLAQGFGYYIFRRSNSEKNRFRQDPNDPAVSHLSYIETKAGTRLLTSGWWGTSRHINYLGDWIMAWSYCLTTGFAGFIVRRSSFLSNHNDEVIPGEARGYGIIFTYFYVVYFAVLLIHRSLRDEEKCRRKYGKDWERYEEIVRWRIVPGIY